jgi:hypothetical protein
MQVLRRRPSGKKFWWLDKDAADARAQNCGRQNFAEKRRLRMAQINAIGAELTDAQIRIVCVWCMLCRSMVSEMGLYHVATLNRVPLV